MRKAVRAFWIIAFSKMVSIVKIGFAVGGFWTGFSLSNAVAPLVGVYAGLLGSGAFLTGNVLFALFLKKSIPLSYLAYSGIPTFFASLYWASPSFFIRALIPAICMLLFVLHPIGAQAWPYALFWLLPIAFYVTQKSKSHIFFTALGSTFVAHAVGSVIWLYTSSMAATYWYSLLPIVPIERVTYAIGMVLFYHLFQQVFSYQWLSFSWFTFLAKKS